MTNKRKATRNKSKESAQFITVHRLLSSNNTGGFKTLEEVSTYIEKNGIQPKDPDASHSLWIMCCMDQRSTLSPHSYQQVSVLPVLLI